MVFIILENAVGREKDVQAIDLDSVMKKFGVTLLVISIFSYSQMNQSIVQTFVILLRFPGSHSANGKMIIMLLRYACANAPFIAEL
jgi:hypothetical protein